MEHIISKINRIAIDRFDDNNSKFAAAMSTSEANIRNYRTRIVPKIDFLIKLHDLLEISFEDLLGQEAKDIKVRGSHEPETVYKRRTDKLVDDPVPVYDLEATAGLVALFEKHGKGMKPIGHISIPGIPKCDGAIHVTGDSMYPLLKSGDLIMYKQVENSVDNIFFGEMYLISVDLEGDNYTTVKWLHRSDKGDQYIKLVSENRHHQPKDVHLSKVSALALVKVSIRRNAMN
jgi:hypothetical protein